MKLNDIRKSQNGLSFNKSLDLKEAIIKREPTIIDLSPVLITGNVAYDNGLYLLNYQLSYQLTLPSTRSLEPVTLKEEYNVSEVFASKEDKNTQSAIFEDELLLLVEQDNIDLSESALDNILLNIPLQVLTDKEKQDDAMPYGDDWSVLTQEQYDAMKKEKQSKDNPFAALSDYFDNWDKKGLIVMSSIFNLSFID